MKELSFDAKGRKSLPVKNTKALLLALDTVQKNARARTMDPQDIYDAIQLKERGPLSGIPKKLLEGTRLRIMSGTREANPGYQDSSESTIAYLVHTAGEWRATSISRGLPPRGASKTRLYLGPEQAAHYINWRKDTDGVSFELGNTPERVLEEGLDSMPAYLLDKSTVPARAIAAHRLGKGWE